jgi:transposase-like protein
LQKLVRDHVKPGAELYTDALKSYEGLDGDYTHQFVDHAVKYAEGKVHTNGLENFWSLLKRSIYGTCVSVLPFHLFRYVDEQAFRFNYRKEDDSVRFRRVLKGCAGRRLTYREVTGKLQAV